MWYINIIANILIDQILRMPAVVNRIKTLFPNETPPELKPNPLLSTIRIPKNIMYLSEHLPKPSYSSILSESDSLQQPTSTETFSLPTIPAQKRQNQKKSKAIYGLKKYSVSKNQSLESISPPDSLDNSILESIQKKLLVQSKEEEKQSVVQEIKKEIPTEDIETQQKIIKKNNHKNKKNLSGIDEKGEIDLIIHQIATERAPIKKPVNRNMQKIANIYSGNDIERIISMHKKYIYYEIIR